MERNMWLGGVIMRAEPRAYEIQSEDGIPVTLPSGATYFVLTDTEEHYLRDKIGRYMSDNHFVNVSDILEIDRMVTFELLIHRWTLWLSRGKDYWNNTINSKQLSDTVQEFCVDLETEILSYEGWKKHDELLVGDLVLTLNDAEMAEWQPVERIHEFTAREVFELRTRDHHSITTPNHRWPVRRVDQRLGGGRRGMGSLAWKTTETLDQRDSLILNARGAAAREAKWSDAFVELVAWYWTEGEGGFYRRRALISQSWKVNSSNCDRIEAALRQEYGSPGPLSRHPELGRGPLWDRKDRTDGLAEFRLGRGLAETLNDVLVDVPRKVVDPTFLAELTQAQLDLFIKVSILGDGWSDCRYVSKAGPQEYEALSQAYVERNRAFEIACILAGRPVRTIYSEYLNNWRTVLTRERACVPLRGRGRVPSALTRHPGPVGVWCPQTANGTWMARRSGLSYFTGNSREIRQLKKGLGVDKTSRDRTRGDDSMAAHWDNLLQRAREFGYLRNEQFTQVITSFQRIKAIVQFHLNSDEIERKENACELPDVLEVIQEEISKFDQIDETFRFEKQRMWIRNQ